MRRPGFATALFSIVAIGGFTHAWPLRADNDLPDGDDADEEPSTSAPAPDELTSPAAGRLGASLPTAVGAADEIAPARVPRMFRELSFRLPRVPLTAVAAHPTDPEILFVGADGFLFKTDDGGESWRPVLTFPRGLSDDVFLQDQRDNRRFNDPLNNDLPTRQEDSDNSEVAFGDIPDDVANELLEDSDDRSFDDADQFGEREQRSSQGGSFADDDDLLPDGDVDVITMQGLLMPERPGVRSIVTSLDGKTVYVGTPRGLYRSINVGETFSEVELPGGDGAGDIRSVALDPRDSSHVFVGTRDGTFVSVDATRSFMPVVGARHEPVLVVSAARLGDSLVVHIGDAVGVMRSWDGGASFLPLLLQGMSAFEPVNALAFDERHGTLYAGTPSGLFVAERRSAILERRLDFFGVPVVSISLDPLRTLGVTIGLDGGGLVASEDTGLTLVDLGDNVPALSAFGISRLAGDPDALIVATERGLFLFDVGTGILIDEDRLRVLEDAWHREPTLRETVEAALDYQQIHPRHFRPLSTRARLSALAPRIQLQYRLSLGRRDDAATRYVLLDDEPDDFDGDDQKDLIDLYDQGLADFAPMRGNFHTIFATFRWRLDRIVFNPNEPRVLRISPTRQRAEARTADQVQALFVARRRLHAQIVLGREKTSLSNRAAAVVRLQELDALLDGMTGGRFLTLATERGGALDPIDPFRGAWLEHERPVIGHVRAVSRTPSLSFDEAESAPLHLALLAPSDDVGGTKGGVEGGSGADAMTGSDIDVARASEAETPSTLGTGASEGGP